MRTLIWRWWLAIGLVAVACYLVAPAGGVATDLVYDVVALASAGAIVAGVRLHRPPFPAMWYLLAAGRLVAALCDVAHLSDAFYLLEYLLTGLGLLLLVKRLRGTIGEFADGAIAAIGASLLFWVFALGPSIPAGARAVSTGFFAADLMMMALLARVLTDSASRTPAIRLLAALTGLALIVDTAYTLVTLQTGHDLHALNALFLLSHLVWAAAALHPSMVRLVPASTPVPGTAVGRRRLVLFAVCALSAPTLLLLPQVAASTADRVAVVAGSVAMFLLTIARMSGIVNTVRRQSAALHKVAWSDELTGLANRRRFDEALTDAAGATQQVVFLGLNGFKNVNDELGRSMGDRVMILLARRIEASVPPGSLVARVGGDEFAVLLPSPAVESVNALAAALREPVEAGGHRLLVGVAIGVTDSDTEPAEVLRRAEAAMYAAKHTGEPVRRWAVELDEHARNGARLGAEMRAGLDQGQFRVVYQPIVDIETGQVAAVEALARWEHPERGLVSPVMFVPAAEQNGLIVELGEWILRTACDQLARWRTELGPDAPGRISVNVSARQLNRPGFAGTVAAALADCGLPASRLAVEVTETAVFEGGQAVTALHELRALGVRIALDDFGTGHSSLGLLQTVPVDILKVDKSFVDGITDAGQQAVIAEALIHVSTGLGLSAVAEGVETAEQVAALRAYGYRLLQGYYFGRPVAEPDFDLVRATIAAQAVMTR